MHCPSTSMGDAYPIPIFAWLEFVERTKWRPIAYQLIWEVREAQVLFDLTMMMRYA